MTKDSGTGGDQTAQKHGATPSVAFRRNRFTPVLGVHRLGLVSSDIGS
jgi:hypothetical protein